MLVVEDLFLLFEVSLVIRISKCYLRNAKEVERKINAVRERKNNWFVEVKNIEKGNFEKAREVFENN